MFFLVIMSSDAQAYRRDRYAADSKTRASCCRMWQGGEVKSIKFLFRLIDDNHSYHRALENPFLLHAGNAICRSGKAFKQLVLQLTKRAMRNGPRLRPAKTLETHPQRARGARAYAPTHIPQPHHKHHTTSW